MKLDRTDIASHTRVQVMRPMVVDSAGTQPTSLPAVVVDFCCGLGGLSLAAQQMGMTVVAGVDTDRNSLKTFTRNFPQAVAIEETISGTRATERCASAISAKCDPGAPLIVLSGPPCQGFSAAGSRDPSDKRNKVLLSVARAIRDLHPACAVIENVQELLSLKHRKRVKDFKQHLKNAGYCTMSVALNAKDYGVAQSRDRAFFLITRDPLDEKVVMQRFAALKLGEVSSSSCIGDLPKAKVRGPRYKDDDEMISATPNHLAMRHSEAVQQKIAEIPVGRGPMSYRKLNPQKPANTLFSGHRAPPAHYKYPRSITVREAARLQGFPDDFRIYGPFSNQMTQVTNAVPPPLARVVLQVIAEFTGLVHRRDN